MAVIVVPLIVVAETVPPPDTFVAVPAFVADPAEPADPVMLILQLPDAPAPVREGEKFV